MRPAMDEAGLVELPQVGRDRVACQERRAGWDQETQSELDGIHVVYQPLALHELEHLEIVLERRPWREGHPRGPEGDARVAHNLERARDIRPRVALLEVGQHGFTQRFHRRDHEGAAEAPQLGENLRALEDVLHLRREVEGERGELGVHRAHDRQRMAGPVQKIRIAEGDVPRTFTLELTYVSEDGLLRYHEEAAAVHGRDRAMQAQVKTAAARLDVAD